MSSPSISLLRLYPAPQVTSPLEGLYLDLNLHRQAADGEMLIYANYIASLDGRISVAGEDGEQQVPSSIANGRDWRLYQELAAQSDIMLTSARYFRQLARGRAQDLLPVGRDPAYADLAEWRAQQGLAPQPAVAILSRSLDIPDAALDAVQDRDIYVLTAKTADTGAIERLRARGIEVIVAGYRSVEGAQLRDALIRLGFRSAYMIAGPEVHATLLAAGVLNRLFLTQYHALLGGAVFHTPVEGGISSPRRLSLRSLYLDGDPMHPQGFYQFELR